MEDSNQKEIVQGYEIKRSVFFEDNQGFALAESPTAPDPFVVWQFNQDDDGIRSFYWGRYCSTIESATMNYENRISTYMHDNDFDLDNTVGAYKYYSTQRPVDIGTYPKPIENTPLQIYNFDERDKVDYERFLAWGYLIYDSPLTDKQIDDYELRSSLNNLDVVAKMKEQAQVVGVWEDSMSLPDEQRFTWHRPSIHAYDLRYPPVSPELMTKRFDRAKREFAYIDKQNSKKPIKEQLAEAEKLVERGDPQKSDKKQNRDER